MATALQYTAEQLNYYRISCVVTDILSEGLRTIFKQEWDNRYMTTLGEWKDQPKNGSDFWNGESHKKRSKNKRLLTVMKNGNRAEWDCTMLFYAILYSDCIQSLNPTVESNVNDLREFRNEEFAHVPFGHLSKIQFQNDILKVLKAFHNLGLDTAKIKEIQNQTSFPTKELEEVLRKVDDLKHEVYEKENKLQEKGMELLEKEGQRQVLEEQLQTEVSSFCILPSAPSHDVAPRTRRVAEITQQLKALKQGDENCLSILYVSGNPGSGKSQLSRLVAKRFYDEVKELNTTTSFVMTLNAENTRALLESYVSFARYCKCPEYAVTNTLKSREIDTNEKITNLKTLISTKIELFTSWLLVVDNVTDVSGIHSHLPDAGNKQWERGQMLITTQDTMSIPLTSSRIQHISVSTGMDPEDARFLLKQLSGVTDDEMEKEVAQVLDYQPLALASAATYVREVAQNKAASNFGWIDYLKKLEEGKRRSTESILAETNSSYPISMTTTIRLALERDMTSHKVIYHTFSFLSLCAPQPILRDVVTCYISETDKEFVDEEMVNVKLNRCSLLLFSEDEGCVYIKVHRVVYEVINTVVRCHTKDEHLKVIHGAITTYSQGIYQDPSKIGQDVDRIFLGKSIVPHIKNLITETDPLFSEQGILEVAESGIVTVQDFTENFITLGEMCVEHCELETALKCFKVVLAFVNLGVVDCNKAEAEAYSGLGKVHCDLGKLEQAKDYFTHALDIYCRNFSSDHVCVAFSYNNLGIVCSRLGDLEQAKDFFLHALDIQTKTLSPDHEDIATCYHNLGILHRHLGDLKQAKFFTRHALVLRIKKFGLEDVCVAFTYYELGVLYWYFGKLKKARDSYEIALNIYMKKLGSQHVKVASAYISLSFVHAAKGNFELVADYHARALDILLKKFGPEHDYVQKIQISLAELQDRMERTPCCLAFLSRRI